MPLAMCIFLNVEADVCGGSSRPTQIQAHKQSLTSIGTDTNTETTPRAHAQTLTEAYAYTPHHTQTRADRQTNTRARKQNDTHTHTHTRWALAYGYACTSNCIWMCTHTLADAPAHTITLARRHLPFQTPIHALIHSLTISHTHSDLLSYPLADFPTHSNHSARLHSARLRSLIAQSH